VQVKTKPGFVYNNYTENKQINLAFHFTKYFIKIELLNMDFLTFYGLSSAEFYS